MIRKDTDREEFDQLMGIDCAFIGNEVPEIFNKDKRDKYIILGYPARTLDKLYNWHLKKMKEREEEFMKKAETILKYIKKNEIVFFLEKRDPTKLRATDEYEAGAIYFYEQLKNKL